MADSGPFFLYPFAVSGNVLTIPQTTQSDGSVSYQQGWGPDYELDLLTDPNALPIPRTSMNQLFNDITTSIQQYQTEGTPDFITTMQAGGSPWAYDIYARVRYDAGSGYKVYENQVGGNTATPGADGTWLVISGAATGVLTGTILDYAGVSAPAGYLTCDGSAVSRSTYASLIGVLSQTQTGTSANTAYTISGLTSTASMYVGMPLESANFPSGTTVATIVDSTDITTSHAATASGSTSIQFFNWGNGDGSTTFNLPDLRRAVTLGQGGSGTATIGNIVGQDGGAETYTMQASDLVSHTHNSVAGYAALVFSASAGSSGTCFTPGSSSLNTSVQVGYSSQTAMNIVQASAVTYKIIKT